MKNFLILLLILIVIGFLGYYFFYRTEETTVENILSFEDCAAAGYPVMESYPRQCRTPEGLLFAEELPQPEITYVKATVADIIPESPLPGSVVGKEFIAVGEAKGTWYFEASFPITLLDKDGKVLVQTYATAQDEWMTENLVYYRSETIKVPETYIGPATLILHRDNASGLPEHDKSISYPITVEY